MRNPLPDLTYNRSDYAALSAHCCPIPIERIVDLYCLKESTQVEQGLQHFLIRMHNNMIKHAIEHNPRFADILKGARRSGTITNRALDILVRTPDLPSRYRMVRIDLQWMGHRLRGRCVRKGRHTRAAG